MVEAERDLLRDNGHEVHVVYEDNLGIKGVMAALGAAWHAPYSEKSRAAAAREIETFKPDIAHVHNFFPLFTPSIYDACRDAGVRIVQTLHNFRTICPNALLMRDGVPCELCVNGSPYQSVRYGCYRNSALATLAVARMVDFHRRNNTWNEKVDRYIALTNFSLNKFLTAGFPQDKMEIKPNFPGKIWIHASEDPTPPPKDNPPSFLFSGRLSYEKGIDILIAAWRDGTLPLLKVAGFGPLADSIQKAAASNLAALGGLAPAQLAQDMKKASCLLAPSVWYENFPMTIVEAYCMGVPVIASRIGSVAEIVKDGVTGLLFEPGNPEDLAAKVRWAAANPDDLIRMGKNARRVYEEKLTPQANYLRLMEIYERALATSQAGGMRP